MNCPVCDEKMREVEKHGVLADICPGCKGIWLDRGELEKIIELMQGGEIREPAQEVATSQSPPPPPRLPAAGVSEPVYEDRPPQRRDHDHDDDDDHHDRREYRSDDPRHHDRRRRRGGILGDLLDMIGD